MNPVAPPANGDCVPGGTCAARATIGNPNTQPLVVSAVAAGSGGGSMGAGGDCRITHVTVEARNGLNIPLPQGTTDVTIPGAFRIAADAPSDCQGRDFQKNLRVIASTP